MKKKATSDSSWKGPQGFRKGGLGVPSLPASGEEAYKGLKKEGMISDVARTNLQFFDPAYFDPILFFLQHKDRKELNYRLRYYYEFNPIVHNIIDLHSTYPLSDFELISRTGSRTPFWNDMKENLELLPYLTDVGKEWWLLGEAVCHGDWDEANAMWHRWKLYPPERVEVRGTYISDEPLLFLALDEKLKNLVKSSDPVDQKIVSMMAPKVVSQIEEGRPILLEPNCTKLFARKTSRYDLRGTSLVKACLKDLMAIDKLRLLQFAYIDRHYSPMKIFKLGNKVTGWLPSRQHFETFRNLLLQLANEPDPTIVWNYGVEVEYVSTKDKIQNLIPEFEFATKNVLAGLLANQALLLGEGSSFNNANIGLRVLSQRYSTFRDMLTLFVRNKMLSPVARRRDWYTSDTSGATGLPQHNINGKYRVLDIPEVKWHKLNLLDDTAQKNLLQQMRQKGEVSLKTMWELMDRDPVIEEKRLQEEEGTTMDPVYQKARTSQIDEPLVAGQILKGVKGPHLNLTPEPPPPADLSRGEGATPPLGGTDDVPLGGESPALLSEMEAISPEGTPPLSEPAPAVDSTIPPI